MVEKRYGVSGKEVNTKLETLKRSLEYDRTSKQTPTDLLREYKKAPRKLAEYRATLEYIKDLEFDRKSNLSRGGNNISSLLQVYSKNPLQVRSNLLVYAGYKPVEIALSLSIYDATMRKAGLERYPGDSALSNRIVNPSLKRQPMNFKEAPGYEGFIKNHVNWGKVVDSLKSGKFKTANFREFIYEGSLELIPKEKWDFWK